MSDPRTLGRYTLKRRLASGGMGEVYLAEVQGAANFTRRVAIKRILPHLARDEGFVARFIDEANLMTRLHHGNIVQVVELADADGDLYLVMDYLPGRDLKTVLRRLSQQGRRLPMELAVWLVTEMLAGLDYAHRMVDESGRALHIVHRDVSPANVCLGAGGEVKLIDFGIARARGGLHQSVAGALQGKFVYMSPEQAEGAPLDARSDIFATGLLLYELLTGVRPFEADSEPAVLRKVREAQVAAPTTLVPALDAELEALLLRALAREPQQRFVSAGEMRRALLHFLADRRSEADAAALAGFLLALFPEGVVPPDGPEEPWSFDDALQAQLAGGTPPGARRRASVSTETRSGPARRAADTPNARRGAAEVVTATRSAPAGEAGTGRNAAAHSASDAGPGSPSGGWPSAGRTPSLGPSGGAHPLIGVGRPPPPTADRDLDAPPLAAPGMVAAPGAGPPVGRKRSIALGLLLGAVGVALAFASTRPADATVEVITEPASVPGLRVLLVGDEESVLLPGTRLPVRDHERICVEGEGFVRQCQTLTLEAGVNRLTFALVATPRVQVELSPPEARAGARIFINDLPVTSWPYQALDDHRTARIDLRPGPGWEVDGDPRSTIRVEPGLNTVRFALLRSPDAVPADAGPTPPNPPDPTDGGVAEADAANGAGPGRPDRSDAAEPHPPGPRPPTRLRIQLVAVPAADVRCDDGQQGTTPLSVTVHLRPVRCTLTADDHVPHTEVLQPGDASRRLPVTLEQLARLTARAEPGAAEILLNGEALKQNPLRNHPLRPGTHRLQARLRLPEGDRLSPVQSITLRPGERIEEAILLRVAPPTPGDGP